MDYCVILGHGREVIQPIVFSDIARSIIDLYIAIGLNIQA